MKTLFDYRENEYFTDKDTYLVKINESRYVLTKLEFSKGYWWTVEALYWKATSVQMVNVNKL